MTYFALNQPVLAGYVLAYGVQFALALISRPFVAAKIGTNAMPHLVLIVAGDNPMLTRRLPTRGRWLIGRAESNEISLNSTTVAEHHAALHLGDRLTVEALESRVHISRIERTDGASRLVDRCIAPGMTAEIEIGQCLIVGTTLLIVHRDDEHVATAKNAKVFAEPIVLDTKMRELHARLQMAAPSDLNVLLLGETGVGKEIFAEMVHRRSARARGPHVRINCGALPETMLEAELFGYEMGAFTGASRAKPGLVEAADGGTVFLDEVGELPLTLQVKLLRVLDEHCVRRLGSTRERDVDVRFIAATNRNLDFEVKQGRFRRDLLFRLNGISFHIPPLRERRDEIAPLADFFLLRTCQRRAIARVILSPEAQRMLERHNWPGNVRELRNVIERAAVFCTRNEILPENIVFDGAGSIDSAAPGNSDVPPESTVTLRVRDSGEEKQRIVKALDLCGGNMTQAAIMLGISRRTLGDKMDLHSIRRPRKWKK